MYAPRRPIQRQNQDTLVEADGHVWKAIGRIVKRGQVEGVHGGVWVVQDRHGGVCASGRASEAAHKVAAVTACGVQKEPGQTKTRSRWSVISARMPDRTRLGVKMVLWYTGPLRSGQHGQVVVGDKGPDEREGEEHAGEVEADKAVEPESAEGCDTPDDDLESRASVHVEKRRAAGGADKEHEQLQPRPV